MSDSVATHRGAARADATHADAPPALPLPWTRSLRITPAQLWELMWSPHGQREWLGPESRVQLTRGVRSALVDEAGVWRMGRLAALKATAHVGLIVEPAASWVAHPPTTVTIDLAAEGSDGTIVSVSETALTGLCAEEAQRYWNRRLDCLEELVKRTRRRRTEVRQAVVVIHGIGEQEPGVTLAQLARSGVLSNETDPKWMKPDRVSGSYDLHSVTLSRSETRPITDVFEFYWAHVIRDTTLFQIGIWLKRVLFRRHVPKPLLPSWLMAWALVMVTAGLALTWLFVPSARALFATATLIIGIVWTLIGRMMAIDVLGDAARYLLPHPANIAHRQTIRKAGVELIQKLHASGRYDRIVILGHSLGSAIAYDIVRHAWADMHLEHRRPSAPAFKDVVEVERKLDVTDASAAQEIQWRAWRQQRLNTQPWLVTDLVTVGSPLTYADVLMAITPQAFEEAKRDRILPECPPTAEVETKSKHRRVTYDTSYKDILERRQRTFTVFHHAAPFAVTRWTNLFFEVGALGLKGDLIGGPVAPRFGPWVRDVPLKAPRRGVTHTWYWRPAGNNAHLEELKKALRIECGAELKAIATELPAVTLVGDADEE